MTIALQVFSVEPDGLVLAATARLNRKGVAVLKAGEGDFERLQRSIGRGVWSMAERRVITPVEGRAYLDAVERMHSRSSGWATKREGY
jgi:hypothetical protein